MPSGTRGTIYTLWQGSFHSILEKSGGEVDLDFLKILGIMKHIRVSCKNVTKRVRNRRWGRKSIRNAGAISKSNEKIDWRVWRFSASDFRFNSWRLGTKIWLESRVVNILESRSCCFINNPIIYRRMIEIGEKFFFSWLAGERSWDHPGIRRQVADWRPRDVVRDLSHEEQLMKRNRRYPLWKGITAFVNTENAIAEWKGSQSRRSYLYLALGGKVGDYAVSSIITG